MSAARNGEEARDEGKVSGIFSDAVLSREGSRHFFSRVDPDTFSPPRRPLVGYLVPP